MVFRYKLRKKWCSLFALYYILFTELHNFRTGAFYNDIFTLVQLRYLQVSSKMFLLYPEL